MQFNQCHDRFDCIHLMKKKKLKTNLNFVLSQKFIKLKAYFSMFTNLKR